MKRLGRARHTSTRRPAVDVAEYAKRLQKTPPRCVRSAAAPARSHDVRYARRVFGHLATVFAIRSDEVGGARPIWAVRSRGREDGAWHSVEYRDPVFVGGPTTKTAAFVFDSTRDGWDGEHRQTPSRRRGVPEQVVCPKCGHDRFRVAAIFQYSGDNEELGEDEPEKLARLQDFFSWFALRVRCDKCRFDERLVSIECA